MPKKKPYVNHVQKRHRLLWTRRHLGWTITQWKSVLWSDKSFLKEMDASCPDKRRKGPSRLSVMVWGCVSALGKGNLHFCDGTINAEKYIDILEQHML